MFSNGVFVKNRIWCTNTDNRLLYAMDIDNGNVSVVCKLSKGKITDKFQYEFVCKISETKLLILPRYAVDLLIYDLLTGEMKTILVEWDKEIEKSQYINTNNKFGCIVEDKDKVFCIGQSFPGILVFDKLLETYQIVNFEMPEDYIFPYENVSFFDRNIYADGKELFIPIFTINHFIVFNIEDYSYNIISLIKNGTSVSLEYPNISGKLRFFYTDNAVYKVYDNTAVSCKLPEEFIGSKSKKWFVKSMIYKSNCYFIPYYSNMILKYSEDNKEIVCVKKYSHIEQFYDAYFIDDKRIGLFSKDKNILTVIHCEDDHIVEVPLENFANEETIWKLERVDDYTEILYEKNIKLQSFIELIC